MPCYTCTNREGFLQNRVMRWSIKKTASANGGGTSILCFGVLDLERTVFDEPLP